MAGTDSIAVISDVHGNRWALEAVLEDVERRGIRRLVNLGDSLYGPLDPAGAAALLLPLNVPTVRGNEDRIIVDHDAEAGASTTLAYVRSQLSADHLRWLAELPLSMAVEPGLFLFHGTPRRDDQYLLTDVTAEGLRSRPPGQLNALLVGIDQWLLLCGHDHKPGELRLADGRLIVNSGSVGLQAYTDDGPYVHAIANGTPHARYAILRRDDKVWYAEFVRIDYDWEQAAKTAAAHGRDDWALWLRTGRVDP